MSGLKGRTLGHYVAELRSYGDNKVVVVCPLERVQQSFLNRPEPVLLLYAGEMDRLTA